MSRIPTQQLPYLLVATLISSILTLIAVHQLHDMCPAEVMPLACHGLVLAVPCPCHVSGPYSCTLAAIISTVCSTLLYSCIYGLSIVSVIYSIHKAQGGKKNRKKIARALCASPLYTRAPHPRLSVSYIWWWCILDMIGATLQIISKKCVLYP